MNSKNKKIIEKALIKRAVGYDAEEIIEEYAFNAEENKKVLIKQKKTTKHFSPDVTAIKILLAYYGEQKFDELESLSDEQLLIERDKLLSLLREKGDNNEIK